MPKSKSSQARIDLDDLLGEKTQHSKTTRSSRAGPSLREPYEVKDEVLFADEAVLLWTLSFCRCGAVYSGPRYAGCSTFIRSKNRKGGVVFTPLREEHTHLPLRVENEMIDIFHCLACWRDSGLNQLSFEFEPPAENKFVAPPVNLDDLVPDDKETTDAKTGEVTYTPRSAKVALWPDINYSPTPVRRI